MMMMSFRQTRYLSSLAVFTAAALIGCSDDESTVPNPHSYELLGPTEVDIRQDSTVSLRSLGFVIVRDGSDTVAGPTSSELPAQGLSYFPENVDIAIASSTGIIRGIGPGSTTIRVTGYDQERTINVNVRPYKATSVILRVLSNPNGGALALTARKDSGIFYALPSNSGSMRLEGLVIVDTSVAKNKPDTVFCNYCPAKTGTAGTVAGPRVNQRIVSFRSLDTTKATISNASDPTAQSSTGTTGVGVVSLDTTSTPVGIVMDVPGDGLADTVWLRFNLRPIDSVTITPGTRAVNATFPSVGTVLQTYPGDGNSANILRSDLENFDANIRYFSRVFSIPAPPSTSGAAGTVSLLELGSTSRPFLPVVTWESALDAYLSINSVGGVTGPCEFIGRVSCPSPTRPAGGGQTAAQRTQAARDSLVISCTDNGTGKRLPGLKADGINPVAAPILFNPPVTLASRRGIYSVPGCPLVGNPPFPGPNIPMPGAFCTTADATDRFSTCTVWIRASITDPVTLIVRSYYYRINIRLE